MHPLNLLELTSIVARFLSPADLASASLVCKEWNASFAPVLWHKIFINKKSVHIRPALASHAHFIQHLDLCTLALPGRDPYVFSTFTRLTTLRLTVEQGLSEPDAELHIALLAKALRRCPAMVKVTIYFNNVRYKVEPLLSAIKEHCLTVQSLSIIALVFNAETMDLLLDICPRLDSLQLIQTSLARVPRMDLNARALAPQNNFTCAKEGFGSSRMQNLLIQHTLPPYDIITDFMALFRGLQRIKIFFDIKDKVSPLGMARVAAAGAWPQLEHLLLQGIEEHLTDKDFAQVLASMKACKTLWFLPGVIGHESMVQLRRHFPTLQVLVAREFELMEGYEGFVPMLLRSCPELKHINVDRVDASCVLEEPAWACLGLTTFEAEIVEKLDHCPPHYSQATFFEKLAPLVNMEEFVFETYGDEEDLQGYRSLLDLRVGRGVEELAGWKALKRLSFGGVPQVLGIKDVEWMVKHWTGLKSWRGTLNTDFEINQELVEYLGDHGIEHEELYSWED